MDLKLFIPLLVVVIGSLAAQYLPVFKTWFGGLTSERRFLFMLLLSAASAVGYALYGLEPGQWLQAALAAIMLWLSNQGVNMVRKYLESHFSKQPDDGLPQ